MSKALNTIDKDLGSTGMSRLTFLKLSGALLGTGLLVACNLGTSEDGSSSKSDEPLDSNAGSAAAAAAVPLVVKRVAAEPSKIPPPVKHTMPKLHRVSISCQEIVGEIETGKRFQYMTFNGQVPAPMLRARQGDTIDLSVTNASTAMHPHSVDFHAVYGPGGGAEATMVAPGQTRHLKFKLMYPGAFIYHCAVPNLDYHISSGMYGLILVEPYKGLPPVDHEFYFGQNEIYVQTRNIGSNGLLPFDFIALTDENPQYVVLNGESEAITDFRYGSLKVKKGETARIFFVNGGPNLISSFHAIGNVWTKVWREGALINTPERYLQTVAVSPGSCAVLEMEFPVPGSIKLVDHSLSRVVHKGVMATIDVEGAPELEIFDPTNTQ
ncbi:Copper-containing nitrite reductase [Candidatus Zixiibacteriota bacterium]|nr:Copper-containing nitrite reductase [candidate division Zixibacteria bacterium]